jgi:hypothetical protein
MIEHDNRDPAKDDQPNSVDHSARSSSGFKAEYKADNTPDSHYQRYDPDEEMDKLIRDFGGWLARKSKKESLGEWVLIVIGTVGAFIYFLQLHSYNRATQNSTQTQVLSNMPLVIPTDIEPTLGINPDGSFFVSVKQAWQDQGETRADSPVVLWGWGTSPPTPQTEYQRVDNDFKKGTWTKGTPAFDTIAIPLDEAQKLAKGPLYFYGKITYDDVFPIDVEGKHRRRDHLVKYCIQIVRFDVISRPVNWGGVPCESGNCYDKNCGIEYAAE